MMLMKTPQGGTATGSGFSREVVFRLTVAPDPGAAAASKAFGDQFVQIQNRMAGVAQLRAKDFAGFYRSAFDEVLKHGGSVFDALADKSRLAANRVAADWSGALRSIGGAGGPMGGGGSGGGSSGFQMNMAGLAASRPPVFAPSPFPSMGGGPAPWAPPKGMAGLGFGAPAWQTSHLMPSMAGGSSSGSPAGGGGGGIAGGGGMRFGSSLSLLTSGAGQFARGIGYSGLAGEKDSQKILETLLRIEGLLALAHGATSIARGLGGMGAFGGGSGIGAIAAPVAAAIAAALATIAAGKVVQEQVSGAANNDNSWSMRIARGWVHAGSWVERGSAALNPFGVDEDSYSGYTQSVLQRNRQQATGAARIKNLRNDVPVAQEDARRMGLVVEDREVRRRGVMGEAAERANLTRDILAMEKEIDQLKQQEAEAAKQGEDAAHNQIQRRKAAEIDIAQLRKQAADFDLNAARQVHALDIQRLQTAQGIAQQRMNTQGGIAKSIGGQFRSDMSKYGALDPLQRMRVDSAAMAFRSGRANREQEELLSGFNEYSDKVDSARATRGMARGGMAFAPDLARDAAAAKAELEKAAEHVQKIQLNIVDKQREWIIKLEEKGFNQDEARQLLEAVKEANAIEKAERVKMIDDLRRELNGQQRARQVIAGK